MRSFNSDLLIRVAPVKQCKCMCSNKILMWLFRTALNLTEERDRLLLSTESNFRYAPFYSTYKTVSLDALDPIKQVHGNRKWQLYSSNHQI